MIERRIVNMMIDELKDYSNDSEHIRAITRSLNYVQNYSDFITILSQGIIAMDSSRRELFNLLVDIKSKEKPNASNIKK